MFNSTSHPCAVIDALTDVTIEPLAGLLLTVRVDVLNDAGIMVVVTAVIDL